MRRSDLLESLAYGFCARSSITAKAFGLNGSWDAQTRPFWLRSMNAIPGWKSVTGTSSNGLFALFGGRHRRGGSLLRRRSRRALERKSR